MRFTRVTLFFIAGIITLGFYQLARNFLAEVEPQTFQATEEMMVDTANLLADLVTADLREDGFEPAVLRQAFDRAHARRFDALIFDHLKHQVGINAYLTDAKGIVLFDSDGGRREGRDFSAKRDVSLTLSGRYGARSSRETPDDASTSVLYVAALVGNPKQPLGVLTVYKPQLDVMPLVRERRRIIYTAYGLIGSGIIFLIGAVFLWLFHPLGKITEYARAIERGERPAKPKIGIGREVNTLAHALDSMRDALEGRRYVERYIQTLTHEMKSPLAAIRGAAELLNEEMPATTRQRFLANILAETSRSDRLINRLLELSADFRVIVERAIEQARPLAELAGVDLLLDPAPAPLTVIGDAFILRAAVTNLLENAIDFSPRGSVVQIALTVHGGKVALTIRDHGPGIPDYAREKVFERFYSLRHPGSGRKGTGLGLTLVREAAELHGGSITLEPGTPGGGTVATWIMPQFFA
ncbi:MAG: two-component system sensor histidine kinase CreC [Verrucomicrobia bacterium]|nr:two-component system sensor histidine kinase CreC [Verrucomicrobiota bacterium]